MKFGKGNNSANVLNRPASNSMGRKALVFVLILITVVLIFWVQSLGNKAQQTGPVTMLIANVQKNQMITEDMLQEYNMLVGEYEKYAYVNSAGETKRRIVLWEEHDKMVGMFAASSIEANTVALKSQLISSRVDNTDSVLYSYPGKELVPLDIGGSNIDAFKSFIEPGDRVNIYATYSENKSEEVSDGYGGTEKIDYTVFKYEPVFEDLMIADILNSSGESVLDLVLEYKNMTVWEQVQADNSEEYQAKLVPATLLITLTPEEVSRYFYYNTKNDLSFTVTMPQRNS